jgi:hypothetical protein
VAARILALPLRAPASFMRVCSLARCSADVSMVLVPEAQKLRPDTQARTLALRFSYQPS